MKRIVLVCLSVCFLLLLCLLPTLAEARGRMRIMRITRNGAFDHLAVWVGPHVRTSDLTDLANRNVAEDAPWITESDVIRENPGRIIFVCEPTRRSARIYSRDPRQWERCLPGARRETWLVTGDTYVVPRSHVPDAEERLATTSQNLEAATHARVTVEGALRTVTGERDQARISLVEQQSSATSAANLAAVTIRQLREQADTARTHWHAAERRNDRLFGGGLMIGILAALVAFGSAFATIRRHYRERTKDMLNEHVRYSEEASELWKAERARLKGEHDAAEARALAERKKTEVWRRGVRRIIQRSRANFALFRAWAEQEVRAHDALHEIHRELATQLAPWQNRRDELRSLKDAHDRACDELVRQATMLATYDELLESKDTDAITRTQVSGLRDQAEIYRRDASVAVDQTRAALDAAFEALTGLPFTSPTLNTETSALRAQAAAAKVRAEMERDVFATLTASRREKVAEILAENARLTGETERLTNLLKDRERALESVLFASPDEKAAWQQEQARRRESTGSMPAVSPTAPKSAQLHEHVAAFGRELYFTVRTLQRDDWASFVPDAHLLHDLAALLAREALCPACHEPMSLKALQVHVAHVHPELVSPRPFRPTNHPPRFKVE